MHPHRTSDVRACAGPASSPPKITHSQWVSGSI